MAKIIRKQEVEISLEEVIRLIKKNWNFLANRLSYDMLESERTVKVGGRFNLVAINDVLNQAEGLIAETNELREAIIQIFRDIEHQNPHFKNINITHTPAAILICGLDVSFDIDIAVAPVMPVDPLDIELDDQGGANPNHAK